MRINKYLSACGLCSRREADRLLEAGRVSLNGITAENGMQVEERDTVAVDGKAVAPLTEKTYLKLYKPVGVVCTEDRRVKNNIIQFLKYPTRVTYAGRLDKDSEGLLIMTNDGDLINLMMRARYGHEKEYKVTVHKEITDAFVEKMSQGVHITDEEKGLDAVTRPCQVTKIGKYTFSIVLTQGLNRQIRRMCDALGYKVTKLQRTRIMNIELGGLKVGAYRKLTKQELEELYERAETGKNAGTGEITERSI